MENLRFAVFGNPIKHSYSPTMHHLFAEQCGLTSFRYTKELVEENAFEQTVHHFFAQGGKGLNITVPFKLKAYELATHHLTPRALAAGAVNTLWLENNNIHGDNTDGIGLIKDIMRLGISLKDKRVLLIGAGGASRGAMLPLLEAGCHHLHIANRTESKAVQMIESFLALQEQYPALTSVSIYPEQFSYSSLTDIPDEWDVIINASASSLSQERLPVPATIFAKAALAYDMLYTPTSETVFLLQAKQAGAAQCSDGLGMLVYQGAEAFAIWNHQYPNPEPVLKALRQALQQHA